MRKSMNIDGVTIGHSQKPYVIAEMSANHNGSIENAFKIIEQAKLCGADAVKIQTYRADTLTIDCDRSEFKIKSGLWEGKTLFELYSLAFTPWEWHAELFKKARSLGITMFSSPFDSTAVDLLEDLNAPAYKIASFEAIDIPLIKYAAQTKKPMIISTGMATFEEICEAIDAAKSSGCQELAVLHCVSGYPALPEDYNLLTIGDMREKLDVIVGLSDHTLDNVTAISAVALGASIIEKHFTLDRSAGGPDDSFSLEPAGLEALCRDATVAWKALGQIDYQRKNSEKENLIFRRSLYVVQDIPAGALLTPENVRSIRPGYGMQPKHYFDVLGKKALVNIARGTPLSAELFELSDISS